MKRTSHLISLIASMSFLLVTVSVLAQGTLSFSADTLIVEACENTPSPMGSITVSNNTSNTITLNWNETSTIFPFTGSTALIIDPIQFPPNVTGGSTSISGNDSTDILFHVWPDSMTVGDSALFQILVYNPVDSMNTQRVLTAIVYCSSSLGIEDIGSENSIHVFPNPLSNEATILINNTNSDRYSLMLFGIGGEFVRKLDLENGTSRIARKGLKSGVYFVRLLQDQQVIATEKLIVE